MNILGFIIAVKSFFAIAVELFESNDQYKYLLSYKFSQDHLEIFFSKIRQRFGYNNNPNVIDFKSSMKQMLLKNSISSSYAANCIAMNNSSIVSIFEVRWSKRKSEGLINIFQEELEEFDPTLGLDENYQLNIVKDNFVYYLCGFIVRKLFKKLIVWHV